MHKKYGDGSAESLSGPSRHLSVGGYIKILKLKTIPLSSTNRTSGCRRTLSEYLPQTVVDNIQSHVNVEVLGVTYVTLMHAATDLMSFPKLEPLAAHVHIFYHVLVERIRLTPCSHTLDFGCCGGTES